MLRGTMDAEGNSILSPTDETGNLIKTPSGTNSLSAYIEHCKDLMSTLLTSNKKDIVNEAFTKLDYENGRGLMACFPLQHAPASGVSSALQRAAKGMGSLRLWMRFGAIADTAEDLHKPGKTIPFVFMVGITSDFGMMMPETGKIQYLELADRRPYTHATYMDPETGTGARFIDTGNLTKEDAVFYLTEFSDSLY